MQVQQQRPRAPATAEAAQARDSAAAPTQANPAALAWRSDELQPSEPYGAEPIQAPKQAGRVEPTAWLVEQARRLGTEPWLQDQDLAAARSLAPEIATTARSAGAAAVDASPELQWLPAEHRNAEVTAAPSAPAGAARAVRAYCGELLDPAQAEQVADKILSQVQPAATSQRELLRITRRIAAEGTAVALARSDWLGLPSAEHVDCDSTHALLAARADGDLSGVQERELEQHLTGCLSCQAIELRTARAVRAFMTTFESPATASPQAVEDAPVATAAPQPQAAAAPAAALPLAPTRSRARKRLAAGAALAAAAAAALLVALSSGSSPKPAGTTTQASTPTTTAPAAAIAPDHAKPRRAAHRVVVHHHRVHKRTKPAKASAFAPRPFAATPRRSAPPPASSPKPKVTIQGPSLPAQPAPTQMIGSGGSSKK